MITSQDFKQAMARLTDAVTVITTCDSSGLPWGFTATTFCSLSLDPPLVLFCLSKDAECSQAFMHGNGFVVHVLAEQQCDLARRFATKGRAKYEEVVFGSSRMGLPLLAGALVIFECKQQAVYPGGDHNILVGQVEQVEHGAPMKPLLYAMQNYGTFVALSNAGEPVPLVKKEQNL